MQTEAPAMTDTNTTPAAEQPAPTTVWLTLGFALAAAVMAGVQRLLPHPANMTLLGALGLWGGARLRPWLGMCLPLAVWAATDVILWQVHNYPFFNPFVYSSFLIYALLGLLLRRTKSPGLIVCACLLGSVQFFLLTNLSNWLAHRADPAAMPAGQSWAVEKGPYEFSTVKYADNVQGLLTCYAFAIPFAGQDPAGRAVAEPLGYFGNLAAGDLVFSGALFGVHALLLGWAARRRQLALAPAQR